MKPVQRTIISDFKFRFNIYYNQISNANYKNVLLLHVKSLIAVFGTLAYRAGFQRE
jgi:hypothetical protein